MNLKEQYTINYSEIDTRIRYTIDIRKMQRESSSYGKNRRFFILLGSSTTGTAVFKKESMYLKEVISHLYYDNNKEHKELLDFWTENNPEYLI